MTVAAPGEKQDILKLFNVKISRAKKVRGGVPKLVLVELCGAKVTEFISAVALCEERADDFLYRREVYRN